MNGTLKYIGFILCVIFSIHGHGQSITSEVSKNPVGAGENFNYSITLHNVKGEVNPPDLSQFVKLMGPNQSSRVQIINGKKEESYTLSWVLRAKQEGIIKIGPASCQTSNGIIKSNDITLTVVKGNASAQNQTKTQAGESKDYFARIYVTNKNPYQGEQIVASYVIYRAVRGFNPQFEFDNTYEGFWKEDIEFEPQWSDDYETIEGRTYQKAVIAKKILMPQKSGDLKINPFTVTGRVGSFFRSKEVNFKSNTVTVNVKPLPPGAPVNFKGAVGSYKLFANIDKRTVKNNEPITFKVKIEGQGNLNLLNEIAIDFPNDFEVYDPEIKDAIRKSGNGMNGYRSFEYLIIPRHSGEYKIDGLSFSYFDPSTKKYKNLKSDDMIIQVEKSGEDVSLGSAKVIRKEDVQLLDNDIRFIDTDRTLRERGTYFFGTPGYVGGICAPAIAFFLFLFVRKRRKQNLADEAGMRNKKAGKVVSKRLAKARKALKNGKTDDFYESLYDGLYGYVTDKLNLQASETSKEHIEKMLQDKGINESVIEDLIGLLNSCEMARFSPITHDSPEVMDRKAEEIINKLEGGLK